MIFAISVFELHIPTARNLKDKRRVVRAVIDRIHRRFRVSIAESDFHDLHQRAEIALALVHNGPGEVEQVLDQIRQLLDEQPESILLSWSPQFLDASP